MSVLPAGDLQDDGDHGCCGSNLGQGRMRDGAGAQRLRSGMAAMLLKTKRRRSSSNAELSTAEPETCCTADLFPLPAPELKRRKVAPTQTCLARKRKRLSSLEGDGHCAANKSRRRSPGMQLDAGNDPQLQVEEAALRDFEKGFGCHDDTLSNLSGNDPGSSFNGAAEALVDHVEDLVQVGCAPNQGRQKKGQTKKLLSEQRLIFAPPTCPRGPESLHDALTILKSVAERISAAGAKKNLNLSVRPSHPGSVGNTLYLTSSYSGWGSAEIALGRALEYLTAAGIWTPTVVMHSAADFNSRCRQALRSHRAETMPRHVLHDILERMPADLRTKLTTLARNHRQSIAERVQETLRTKGRAAALAERKDLIRNISSDYVALARTELSKLTFSRDQRCRCDVHPHRRCRAAPPASEDDFWLEVAGTTCVAWSTKSTTGWGWLDESGLPCLVWCYWVLGTEPDAVAHEIVAGKYKPHVMIDILSPIFTASSIVSSPTFWGIPSHRTRRYSVFLHKKFKLHGFAQLFPDAGRPSSSSSSWDASGGPGSLATSSSVRQDHALNVYPGGHAPAESASVSIDGASNDLSSNPLW